MDDKRNHFRLQYPPPERPWIEIAGSKFEVFDLSEGGVRFDCGPTFRPAPKSPIQAKITFKDGTICLVRGSVLRFDAEKRHIIILLAVGVPYPKMMEEHRRILQKYKQD